MKGNTSAWIKKYDLLWMAVVAICAGLMLFMWFETDHIPTKDNWNLLWANPFIPILWFNRFKKSSLFTALKYGIGICLGLTMVNAIPGVQILPQFFHPVTGLIAAILLLKGWRIITTEVN